jgi:hypothetical protein
VRGIQLGWRASEEFVCCAPPQPDLREEIVAPISLFSFVSIDGITGRLRLVSPLEAKMRALAQLDSATNDQDGYCTVWSGYLRYIVGRTKHSVQRWNLTEEK